MDTVTLYNKTSVGKTKVWSISLGEKSITVEWGLQDGKKQTVTEYGQEKNVGKANYISEEEDASNLFARKIKAKRREGYRDSISALEGVDPLCEIPEEIRYCKPQNSMSGFLKKKLEKKPDEIVTARKYDGECFIVHKTTEDVIMYSRTMLQYHHHEVDEVLWNFRFAHIEEEMLMMPQGTILLNELIAPEKCDEGHYIDDRNFVAKVMKSKSEKAFDLQFADIDNPRPLVAMIWDVHFLDGKDLLAEGFNYLERLALAQAHIDEHELEFIDTVDAKVVPSIEAAEEEAKARGWEGFVIRSLCEEGFVMYQSTGKVPRAKSVAKLKPVFEDDFIAEWDPDAEVGLYGKGRYTGLLGSVELYQYDCEGNKIHICKLGNGWSKDFIEQNSTPEDWPKVLKVEYTQRTYLKEGGVSNALQFGRFHSVRTDKAAEECINERL